MVSFAQPVFWQIRYLVTGLSKRNYKACVAELRQLVQLYGYDAQAFLLRTLVEELQFHDARGGAANKDQLKLQLLQNELQSLDASEELGQLLRQALDGAREFTEEFILQFSKAVKLSQRAQFAIVAACLVLSSDAVRREGLKLLRSKLREASGASASVRVQLLSLPDSLLQSLVAALRSSSLDEFFEREGERDSMVQQLLDGNPEADLGCGSLSGLIPSQRSALMRLARQEKTGLRNDLPILSREVDADFGVRPCDLIVEIASSSPFSVADVKRFVQDSLSVFSSLEESAVAGIICAAVRVGCAAGDTNQFAALAAGSLSAVMNDSWTGDSYEYGASADNSDARGLVTGIIQSASESLSGVDWELAFDYIFDLPDLCIPNACAFELILLAYAEARGGDHDRFPLSAVFKIRKNTKAQLQFLWYAAKAKDQPLIDFKGESSLLQPVLELLDVDEVKPPWWACRDYLEILFELAEVTDYGYVQALLDEPLHSNPEALLVGICLANDSSHGSIKAELMSELAPPLFDIEAAKSTRVQTILAKHAPKQLRCFLRSLYERKPEESLPRILDILNKEPLSEFKSELFSSPPTELTSQVVLYASSRGTLALQNWLQNVLRVHRDVAALGLVRFLRARLQPPRAAHWPANVDEASTLQTYISALHEALRHLSPESVRKIRELGALALQAHPQLKLEESKAEPVAEPAPPAPPAGPPPSAPPVQEPANAGESALEHIPENLEAAANQYFSSLYSGVLSVQSLVEMLTRFKSEPESSWNHSVYDRIVQSLFDECRYFPKYPEEDLVVTGKLFGSLINYELVEPAKMSTALRCILEAFRRPERKMFNFAVLALEEVLPKLPTWPQLCSQVTQMDQLAEHYPSYVQYARDILAALPPEAKRSIQLRPDFLQKYSMPPPPPKQGTQAAESARPSAASAASRGRDTQGANAPPATMPPPRQPPPPAPVDNMPPAVAHPARPADMPAPPRILAKADSAAGRAKAAAVAPVASGGASSSTQAAVGGATLHGGPQTVEQLLNDPELQVEQPPAWFADNVAQIFNSLSKDNLEQKTEALRNILSPEHCAWFANYVVKNRASKEVNHHPLYISFLEQSEYPKIFEHITNTTYSCLRVLLRSVDQAVVSTSHRTMLKNLGFWLGQITLGRNRVLKSKYMDLKYILIDAFENGSLTAVLPLVCKILEGVQKSKVYKPPNPWTLAIMGLLSEIHDVPNLRTNLMFEVEVLCKHIDIKLGDVKRTACLVGKQPPPNSPDISASRQQEAEQRAAEENRTRSENGASGATGQLRVDAAPFSAKAIAAVATNAAPKASDAAAQASRRAAASSRGSADPSASAPEYSFDDFIVPNLQSLVTISESVTFCRESLPMIVPLAVDRAVRELLPACVQRAVSIACLITADIVTKDFAVEPDEEHLLRGAKMMASCVAGSLALVTCHEPIRQALVENMFTLLEGAHPEASAENSDLCDAAVQQLVNDNLSLCCGIIEKGISDRTEKDVEVPISAAIKARKEHRAKRPSVPYFDRDYVHSYWPQQLPEMLRPKPGCLSAQHLKVYNDFLRIPEGRSQLARKLPPLNFNDSSVFQPQTSLTGGASTYTPLPFGGSLFSRPATSDIGSRHSQEVKDVADAIFARTQQTIKSLIDDLPLLPPIDCSSSALYKNDDALDACQSLSALPLDSSLAQLLKDAPQEVARCRSPEACTLELASRVFQSLFAALRMAPQAHRPDVVSPMHVTFEVYFSLLDKMRREHFSRALTGWLDFADDAQRFSVDAIAGFLRYNLVALPDVDNMLSKWISETKPSGAINVFAVEFATNLFKRVCLKQRFLTRTDFKLSIDALRKVAGRCRQTASAASAPQDVQLAEAALKVAEEILAAAPINEAARQVSSRISQRAREEERRIQAGTDRASTSAYAVIYEEWRTSNGGTADGVGSGGGQACATVLTKITQLGFVASEDAQERFFTFCCERAVGQVLVEEIPTSYEAPPAQRDDGVPTPAVASGDQAQAAMNFSAVDAFSRLIYYLMRCGDKVQILTSALNAIVQALLNDSDSHDAELNQRPYYRLLLNVLSDIVSPDPSFEQFHVQLLSAFANALHQCSPLRVPSFAFSWLELASHRLFVPKLLKAKGSRGYLLFQRLLCQLLHFLKPHLRGADLTDASRLLYKGTVRVLLVLLHDFPEFLCEYHFTICDFIPVDCIQVRNLILSAFPRNMKLPDPFMPNLKVDLLPEIKVAPRILANYVESLHHLFLKADVDSYMRTREPRLLETIKEKLRLPAVDHALFDSKWNLPLLNALLLYVGVQLPQHGRAQISQGNMQQNNPSLEIFMYLAHNIDEECRYMFLGAIANHLRYPNTHTHFFSCVLLYLFSETSDEVVREQITRVLLERLIVHRPHPWGLLITFVELIKNRRYQFWHRPFVNIAPEIERLFQSVAYTCLGPDRQGEHATSVTGGAGPDLAAAAAAAAAGIAP
eukprot:TRINITY_DN894_c1_g2_i1.p1 TRINITY_DN894_c1_g2~~TRINITY_DN894_c1_g2_i1.p1  ORF type:complete len:2458 (+),score=390.25 TRINITY_DN894_c1_g2_i1:119-7492(+)